METQIKAALPALLLLAFYYYIKAALPALLLALYSLFAKLGMSYNKRIMIIAKSRDYITEIPTKYLLLLATE